MRRYLSLANEMKLMLVLRRGGGNITVTRIEKIMYVYLATGPFARTSELVKYLAISNNRLMPMRKPKPGETHHSST